MAETQELVARLQKIPLFRRIDAHSLAILTQFLHEEEYQDGETIFRERDPGGSMYAIESGAVVISKVIDWQDHTEKTLAILPAGAFFGEGGLLENDARSANVRARGHTRVIRVDRDGFLQVLQEAPLSAIQVLFGITRIINARLRQTSHELVTLFDTGKLAGAGLDLDSLLKSILERCMESTDSQQGAVFLVNPYTEELEVGAFLGLAPAPPFDRHAGLFGRVLDEGQPVLARDFAASGLAPQGFEPTSLVASGIQHEGAPIGLLLIGDREGGASYTGGHVHLLQGIAMQVAPAIVHARKKAEDEAAEAHNRHYVRF